MKVALARVEKWNLGLSASAVAASFALETSHFATSLAAGVFLEAINLRALRRSASRLFAGRMTRSWTGVSALRFVVLGTGIYLTIRAGAHPIALLIGLSIVQPALLIDAWRSRPPILDPATLPVISDENECRDDDDFFAAAEERAADDALGRLDEASAVALARSPHADREPTIEPSDPGTTGDQRNP